MDEIIKKLATHLNISEETASKALGAVMVFLKEHLPAGLASQLQTVLPESTGLATNYEATREPAASAGLMSVVTDLAGKFLGGQAGAASKLASMLGQAGLSMDQITRFLPQAADLLKTHLPPEIYAKIVELIPGMDETPVKV